MVLTTMEIDTLALTEFSFDLPDDIILSHTKSDDDFQKPLQKAIIYKYPPIPFPKSKVDQPYQSSYKSVTDRVNCLAKDQEF